jgi:hypothetical protein
VDKLTTNPPTTPYDQIKKSPDTNSAKGLRD